MICGSGASSPGTPFLISQSPYLIELRWTEPYDNGGTEIVSYTLEITDIIANNVLTFTIIDSLQFSFDSSTGLVSGTQYQARVYANNFVTQTYPAVLSSWSGDLFYFTSEVVTKLPTLSATSVTITSAVINWNLLTT